jgi:predicted RNA-binding Zn-ribbon protein involved in translation (DUF1610 family)
MKTREYQLKDGRFLKNIDGKFMEFYPTRIWCQDCGRRLSLKKYKENGGVFICPQCGNEKFIGFNEPE